MPNLITGHVSGELLRELRVAHNLEIQELSKRTNLSVQQIEQLETGAVSAFYNLAIRECAARKVALLLGANLDASVCKDAAPIIHNSDKRVMDELVELLEPDCPSFFTKNMRCIIAITVFLVVMGSASSWLYFKWNNGGAEQFWYPVKSNSGSTIPILSRWLSSSPSEARQPPTPASDKTVVVITPAH